MIEICLQKNYKETFGTTDSHKIKLPFFYDPKNNYEKIFEIITSDFIHYYI